MHVLALPLAYIYARQRAGAAVRARPDKAMFAAFLDWARTRYRRVLFIGGGGTDLLSHWYGVRAARERAFQVPEYEAPLDAYPRFVRAEGIRLRRLRVHRRRRSPDAASISTSASDDDLHVAAVPRQGTADGHTFRWTRATSYVVDHRLHRRAARGDAVDEQRRPARPAAPPASVTRVPARTAARHGARSANGFAPYTLADSAGARRPGGRAASRSSCGSSTTVWNPHDGARHARRPRPRRHGRSRGGKITPVHAPERTMPRLQIYDRRERALVAAADRAARRRVRAGAAVPSPARPPARRRGSCCLRLERIGDLLMALPAIADVRALAPDAAIDLVVGSWNARARAARSLR